MNKVGSFDGIQIYESLCVPEQTETHRQERKWAHRVMWRRNQRFRFTYELCALINKAERTMVMHPASAAKMMATLETGIKFAQPGGPS